MDQFFATSRVGILALVVAGLGACAVEVGGELTLDGGVADDEGDGSDDQDDADLTEIEARGCAAGGIEVWDSVPQYHSIYDIPWVDYVPTHKLVFCSGRYPDLTQHRGGLEFWQVFATWNDIISMVETFGRCGTFAYEHINYGGRAYYIPKNVRWSFGEYLFWNDRISSMKIGRWDGVRCNY